jgi:hypothetical protein
MKGFEGAPINFAGKDRTPKAPEMTPAMRKLAVLIEELETKLKELGPEETVKAEALTVDATEAHVYASPRGVFAYGGTPEAALSAARKYAAKNGVSVFVYEKSPNGLGTTGSRTVEINPDGRQVMHNDPELVPKPSSFTGRLD